MEDFITYFNKKSKEVDIYRSVEEERRRYLEAPRYAKATPKRLRQWLMIQIASKWEYLGRQQWMSRDKYQEKDTE